MDQPNDEKRNLMWNIINASRNGKDWSSAVDQFLSNGGDINIEFNHVSNLLHMAAKSGRIDVMKKVLDSGANIDYVCDYNETALFKATFSGHIDCIKMLLDYGADVIIIPYRYESKSMIEMVEFWDNPEITCIYRDYEKAVTVDAKSTRKK